MSETNETNETATRTGCPIWVKGLLVLSLAGNLAVAGLVGGWMVMGGHDGKGERELAGLDPRAARMVRILPEKRRDAARQAFIAMSEQVAPHRQRITDVHTRFITLMRSDRFAPDEAQMILAERRAVMSELSLIYQGKMVTIMSDLSPAERAEIADRLERLTRRWSDRNMPR